MWVYGNNCAACHVFTGQGSQVQTLINQGFSIMMTGDHMPSNLLATRSAKPAWLFPAMILGAQSSLVFQHLRNLWADTQYQFFPLVLVACVLFYVRRREPSPATERYVGGQLTFLVSGLIVFAVAIMLQSPWLATAAAILSCGCFFLRSAGPGSVRQLLAAWALLWLLLPLPMGFDDAFRQFMQMNCSAVSSRILDFVGVNHLMYGNVLMANNERYFVDEACSGMRSLVSMLAIVSIYVVAMRRSIVPSLGLLSLSVVSCFVMNAVRITSVILLDPKVSVDLSTGWAHEAFGLGIFAITLVMLFSADGLMMYVTAPIHVPDVFERLEERNGLVRLWNWFFVPAYSPDCPKRTGIVGRSLPTILSSMGLLFFAVSVFGEFAGIDATHRIDVVNNDEAVAKALALKQEDLDLTVVDPHLQVASFQATSRGNRNSAGQHSRAWGTSIPGGRMTISLDFPFVKFHDLTVCYHGQGWRILSDDRHCVNPETSLDTDTFHEVRMERAPGEFGYLYYGLFNSTANDGGDGITSKLMSRSKLSTEPLLQAQCFVETQDDLTVDERHKLMTRYIACRNQLRKRIYGSRL